MFKQIQKTLGIVSLVMFAAGMIAVNPVFAEEAPPTLNIPIPSDSVITSLTVTPASFDPVTQTTDISFTTSASGFITVEILDGTAQKKVLINNESMPAGTYSKANKTALGWDGKDSTAQILPNKTYTVKVSRKQTSSGSVLDTKTADVVINVPASNPTPPPADPNPTPPANPNPTPPVDPPKTPEKITLVNVKADPKKFNPAIDETEISYTIFSSYGAKIEVKILNEDKEKVVTLVDKKQDAGKQTVVWYGTKDNKEDGKLVDAGTYTYKIIAKNPTTSDTEDTEDGKIEVFVSNVINDKKEEEEPPKADNVSGQSGIGNIQTNATMALNNTNTGEVANTGPGILIYVLFPLAGLIAAKKFKK